MTTSAALHVEVGESADVARTLPQVEADSVEVLSVAKRAAGALAVPREAKVDVLAKPKQPGPRNPFFKGKAKTVSCAPIEETGHCKS